MSSKGKVSKVQNIKNVFVCKLASGNIGGLEDVRSRSNTYSLSLTCSSLKGVIYVIKSNQFMESMNRYKENGVLIDQFIRH
jgi:hypothetical protein